MGDFDTTPVVLNNQRRVIRPLENPENPWFIDQRNGVVRRPITRALTRALASTQALPDDMDVDVLADLVWKRRKQRARKTKKVPPPVRATKSKKISYLLKNMSRQRANRTRNRRNSQRASRAEAHRKPRPASAPTPAPPNSPPNAHPNSPPNAHPAAPYYRGRTAYGPHEPPTPNMSQRNQPGSQNANLAAIAEEWNLED